MNNDKGEQTCPLCAEEMDLTDQHLNPCKCGYQICVWCWHHIIEMAEKDKTQGRCPACRTPYDKEKVVGMTASCERLVAELNNDRKKSLKAAKPRAASEGRKDLSLTGVRVIQRNLVYVMSLPFDLADEDRFQRREYFGQYGKVVKVAMSRTQAGDIQLFPNDSCSVYITYSKEEEAIRCIRSIHQFVLDGRILKACFGTMKYCHAWLRNMPCNNAECLYLHEIGAPEDSFTKDETVSVHMRKIIDEITGAVANFPRRSGYMLPPPVDDFIDRQNPKCVPNNSHSVAKTSRPNSSNGRSVTLPAGALWGMHASSQSSVPNTPRSGEPLRDKAVTVSSGELLNSQSDFPELSLVNRPQTSNSKALVSASMDSTRAVSVPSACTDFSEPASQSCGIQSVCNDSVSVGADSVVSGYEGLRRSDSSDAYQASLKTSHTEVSQDSLQHFVNETREVHSLKKTGLTNTNEVAVPREEVSAGSALMSPLVTDISSFIRERLKDPEVFSCQPNKSGFLRTMQPSSSQYKADHDETRSLFRSSSVESRGINVASISHGYNEAPQSEPSGLNGSLNHSMGYPDRAMDTQSNGNSRSEIDDSIANILSLDLDEYLTSSTHNLSKQLGAGDLEARSRKVVSSCEVKNNQSRFSFARQDESKDNAFGSCNVFNQIPHSSSDNLYKNSSEQQSSDLDMIGMYNGISSSYLKGVDHVTQNSALHSSYKPPSIPRCPVTAPPGFSVASRPPPPGFASNGREQQTFNGFSGNHRYSDSPVYINPYHQSLPTENNGGVRDVQFMDPAIMAVGQGFENPSLGYRGNTNMFAKFQQQQSPLTSHQNCRLTDSLGMASRFIDQSQGSSNILSRNMGLPSGQWDGLSNEIQSLNRLQNERFTGSTNRMMSGYSGTFRI